MCDNSGGVCEVILNFLFKLFISICLPFLLQEEYVDGDDVGKLDCGHDFHFTCVKQWLVLKNSCPICKMMALACRDRDN